MADPTVLAALDRLLELPAQLDRIESRLGKLEAAMQRRDLPPWISPARWSEEGNLSVATVRRRIADGTLVAKKMGGRILVSTDSLKAIDDAEVARHATRAVGR